MSDYDIPCCDICCDPEIVLVVGMEGMPWAYNICSSNICRETAENKLRNIARTDMGESYENLDQH